MLIPRGFYSVWCWFLGLSYFSVLDYVQISLDNLVQHQFWYQVCCPASILVLEHIVLHQSELTLKSLIELTMVDQKIFSCLHCFYKQNQWNLWQLLVRVLRKVTFGDLKSMGFIFFPIQPTHFTFIQVPFCWVNH